MNFIKNMKFISSKKAVIEISFSWIFILIAGVVILGLFVYVGFNQGNFFRTLLTANMLKDLNAIFISAQVSKNTAAIFPIPTTNLEFGCNSYSIEGVSHSLAGQYIFAPTKLKTDRIISWSKPWSLGFRITNFLFLTSPYIKHYIVYDPSDSSMVTLARDIYNDFPRHLQVETLQLNDTSEIKNQNFERIHILMLGINPNRDLPQGFYDISKFRRYKNNEITFIYAYDIDTTTLRNSLTAKISFKDKEGKEVRNLGAIYDISSIYAAFISGDFSLSLCVLVRAFRKAPIVANIYKERTIFLDNLNCQTLYSQSDVHFQNIIDNLLANSINVEGIKSEIIDLNFINDVLETYSCPLIY